MPEQRNRAVWDLVASHALFTQGLKAAGAAMGQFANIVRSTQFLVGASAAAMGVAFFKAAQKGVAMAAILDSSMREVATLIPQTTEQLEGLRDTLIDMSTRVPQAPELLTQGVYQAISAGITDTSEALQVVETSAKAAVAGLTDTFTAVDAITTVLNAYQLEASEAARVSDTLFKTVEQGKVRFPELAQNIGNVVTSASLAGIEFEQVAAAIATVTKFGIGAAEATTSLNRAILSIIKPTKAQTDAAKEYGIELSAAALAEKGLVGFVRELNEATEGQVDALAKVFPNIRAFRSISILAGKGIDEYNRILVETENSSGAAATAFEEVNGSLQNQSALLRNNINVLFQKLGAKILPGLVSTLEGVNKTLQTNEARWREAAEAAGDYETVVNQIRQEAIERLQDEMAKLQAQLARGAQEWDRLSLPQFDAGFLNATDDLRTQLTDIRNTTVDFGHDLESATQRAKELVADWAELREFVKLTVDDNEAIVGFLNLRIQAMEELIRKAERLDLVERELGTKAGAKSAQELKVEEIRKRLEKARQLAPGSDLAKQLDKAFRLETARLDIEIVRNKLLQERVATEALTIAQLEEQKKARQAAADAARVEVAQQTLSGVLIGGGVAAAINKVELEGRLIGLLGDEIAARKVLAAIIKGDVASTQDKFVPIDSVVSALEDLVALGADPGFDSLLEKFPELKETIEELDIAALDAARSQERLADFLKLSAESLKEFRETDLELPAGVDLLSRDEANLRTRIGAFRQYANTIAATYKDATSAALEMDAVLRLFNLDIEDLDDDTRAWVESWIDVGTEVTETQKKVLQLIDDISFGINSALALADAFGLSSQEVNTLIRNVDLLGRSLEKIVLTGGLDFQSAFGAGAALLSIGSNLFGFGGESPEEKARREALKANTAAVLRLKQSVDAQIAALEKVQSADFARVADAINDTFSAGGFVQRFEGRAGGGRISIDWDESDMRNLFGADWEAIQRAATALQIPIPLDDWEGLKRALETINEELRNLDLAILRETFEGIREWETLVAEVFDEPLGDVQQFEILREALKAGIPSLEALVDLQSTPDDALDFWGQVAKKLSPEFYKALFGPLSDPATVQAWEDFQRFLVENFDQLFTEGFFGGLNRDEALQLLRDIDQSTDALQESAAAASGVDAVTAVNKLTVEQGDLLIALTSTGNFYLGQIRDNTAGILSLIGSIEGTGIAPPTEQELRSFGGRPSIGEINIDVDISGVEDPDEIAVRVGESITREVDARLGRQVSDSSAGYGTATTRVR